jgi:LEA14-like dessication related protein
MNHSTITTIKTKYPALLRFIYFIFIAALLNGCANLSPYDAPKVDLIGLEALPSKGNELQFRVQLKIINPNNKDIHLEGVNLNLGLNNYDLISGSNKQQITLPALGEARMQVDLTLSILNGLGLMQSLITQGKKPLSYQLEGKLFTSEAWLPNVPFEKSGDIALDKK